MAFFSCDVVPNPSGVSPHRVVFKRDGKLLAEWPVNSIAEGEAQIAAALASITDLIPENGS